MPQGPPKRKTSGRQLDREIAQKLAASGQPRLAELFADPEATKIFVREARHEIQKQQTSARTAANLAEKPFTVKRLEEGRPVLFGRYALEDKAREIADRVGGWAEYKGQTIYKAQSSTTRSHSTRLDRTVIVRPTAVRWLGGLRVRVVKFGANVRDGVRAALPIGTLAIMHPDSGEKLPDGTIRVHEDFLFAAAD